MGAWGPWEHCKVGQAMLTVPRMGGKCGSERVEGPRPRPFVEKGPGRTEQKHVQKIWACLPFSLHSK